LQTSEFDDNNEQLNENETKWLLGKFNLNSWTIFKTSVNKIALCCVNVPILAHEI